MTRPGDEARSGEVPLTDEARAALSFQTYREGPRIEGVETRTLRKHRSENGWFAELLRLNEDGAAAFSTSGDPWPVRQVSASQADPDRINAFHIHPLRPQNELWTVLAGTLLVWLVDCREGSPTAGLRQRILLSHEAPVQLHIPAGVAHGYRAGPRGALLVYAMDRQFDREHPNEGRLPWDHFGAELWEEDRG